MFENGRYVSEQTQTDFMTRVYSWMCFALMVTAATAWYMMWTPLAEQLMQQPMFLIVIILGQLGLVIALSAMLNRISYVTAIALFLGYAVSLGVTMSLVLSAYTAASVWTTFVVASGMFGGMALYGYFTKADLSAMHNILIMVLWGMIVAMLINMFVQSARFDYVVSMIGVVVFALLTASDTQKLKTLSQNLLVNDEVKNKIALIGALTLYLDFINLFLFLLRFTGQRRNQ